LPKTYLTYDVTHKKHETQNQKIFFTVVSNTCRVFGGLEQLSSAIS